MNKIVQQKNLKQYNGRLAAFDEIDANEIFKDLLHYSKHFERWMCLKENMENYPELLIRSIHWPVSQESYEQVWQVITTFKISGSSWWKQEQQKAQGSEVFSK